MQDQDVDHASADYDVVMRCIEVVVSLDESRGEVDASGGAEAAELDHFIPLEGRTTALVLPAPISTVVSTRAS